MHIKGADSKQGYGVLSQLPLPAVGTGTPRYDPGRGQHWGPEDSLGIWGLTKVTGSEIAP